jgi:prepilin-type N-terminal cleavage/methylation domain-containing protein
VQQRRAFTLMEILVALAVMVLLVGAVTFLTQSTRRGQLLQDAGQRWATAFRMARAESSLRGKRIQLAFVESESDDESVMTAEFQIEKDPLGSPNQFTRISDAWASRLRVTGIHVSHCLLDETTADEDVEHETVLFYPDGSSDSANLHLRHDDPDQTRMIVVHLDGLTGKVEVEKTLEEFLDEETDEDSDKGDSL